MKERLYDIVVHEWYAPPDRDVFCCWVTCGREQSRLEIEGTNGWLTAPSGSVVRGFFEGTVLPQMLARAQYCVWVAAHGCTPMPNPAVRWKPMWTPPA